MPFDVLMSIPSLASWYGAAEAYVRQMSLPVARFSFRLKSARSVLDTLRYATPGLPQAWKIIDSLLLSLRTRSPLPNHRIPDDVAMLALRTILEHSQPSNDSSLEPKKTTMNHEMDHGTLKRNEHAQRQPCKWSLSLVLLKEHLFASHEDQWLWLWCELLAQQWWKGQQKQQTNHETKPREAFEHEHSGFFFHPPRLTGDAEIEQIVCKMWILLVRLAKESHNRDTVVQPSTTMMTFLIDYTVHRFGYTQRKSEKTNLGVLAVDSQCKDRMACFLPEKSELETFTHESKKISKPSWVNESVVEYKLTSQVSWLNALLVLTSYLRTTYFHQKRLNVQKSPIPIEPQNLHSRVLPTSTSQVRTNLAMRNTYPTVFLFFLSRVVFFILHWSPVKIALRVLEFFFSHPSLQPLKENYRSKSFFRFPLVARQKDMENILFALAAFGPVNTTKQYFSKFSTCGRSFSREVLDLVEGDSVFRKCTFSDEHSIVGKRKATSFAGLSVNLAYLNFLFGLVRYIGNRLDTPCVFSRSSRLNIRLRCITELRHHQQSRSRLLQKIGQSKEFAEEIRNRHQASRIALSEKLRQCPMFQNSMAPSSSSMRGLAYETLQQVLRLSGEENRWAKKAFISDTRRAFAISSTEQWHVACSLYGLLYDHILPIFTHKETETFLQIFCQKRRWNESLVFWSHCQQSHPSLRSLLFQTISDTIQEERDPRKAFHLWAKALSLIRPEDFGNRKVALQFIYLLAFHPIPHWIGALYGFSRCKAFYGSHRVRKKHLTGFLSSHLLFVFSRIAEKLKELYNARRHRVEICARSSAHTLQNIRKELKQSWTYALRIFLQTPSPTLHEAQTLLNILSRSCGTNSWVCALSLLSLSPSSLSHANCRRFWTKIWCGVPEALIFQNTFWKMLKNLPLSTNKDVFWSLGLSFVRRSKFHMRLSSSQEKEGTAIYPLSRLLQLLQSLQISPNKILYQYIQRLFRREKRLHSTPLHGFIFEKRQKRKDKKKLEPQGSFGLNLEGEIPLQITKKETDAFLDHQHRSEGVEEKKRRLPLPWEIPVVYQDDTLALVVYKPGYPVSDFVHDSILALQQRETRAADSPTSALSPDFPLPDIEHSSDSSDWVMGEGNSKGSTRSNFDLSSSRRTPSSPEPVPSRKKRPDWTTTWDLHSDDQFLSYRGFVPFFRPSTFTPSTPATSGEKGQGELTFTIRQENMLCCRMKYIVLAHLIEPEVAPTPFVSACAKEKHSLYPPSLALHFWDVNIYTAEVYQGQYSSAISDRAETLPSTNYKKIEETLASEQGCYLTSGSDLFPPSDCVRVNLLRRIPFLTAPLSLQDRTKTFQKNCAPPHLFLLQITKTSDCLTEHLDSALLREYTLRHKILRPLGLRLGTLEKYTRPTRVPPLLELPLWCLTELRLGTQSFESTVPHEILHWLETQCVL